MNLFRASFDDEGELLIETTDGLPSAEWFPSKKEALKALRNAIRRDIFDMIDDLAATRDAMLYVEKEMEK